MTNSLKHWYPRYSGDYRAKTAGLSLIQHGAYTLLLDEYYNTGIPLPANAVQLHRVCSALAPDEQEAVNFILDNFFTKTPEGYTNKRAEEELTKRVDISEKRKKAANTRYAKAPAIAHTSTSTSTSTSITTPKKDIGDFDDFWNTYGYKIGKDKAEPAYNKLIKKGVSHDEVIQGVRGYQQDCQTKGVTGKFIKHPTSWLNGGHWCDEYPEYTAEPEKLSKHQRAKLALARSLT